LETQRSLPPDLLGIPGTKRPPEKETGFEAGITLEEKNEDSVKGPKKRTLILHGLCGELFGEEK